MTNATPIIQVSDVTVEFKQRHRRMPLLAVDDVSLDIQAGETVGLVGESGSGKTTLGGSILGLVPTSRGTISFQSRDITHASREKRRELSAHMQVVFQDPYGSLNPARTIGQTLSEPLLVHRRFTKREQRAALEESLSQVGLPTNILDRYPHSFSGGQRQRISIARALMTRPELVVADEPVSALDLSSQAQIINLFIELRESLKVSVLFISHNLAVVEHLAQRVVVLYRGRVMESGTTAEVCRRPVHPYARALLAAVLIPDPARQAAHRRQQEALRRDAVASDESSENIDSCVFANRCPYVEDVCLSKRPELERASSGSLVDCLRHREIPEPPESLRVLVAE